MEPEKEGSAKFYAVDGESREADEIPNAPLLGPLSTPSDLESYGCSNLSEDKENAWVASAPPNSKDAEDENGNVETTLAPTTIRVIDFATVASEAQRQNVSTPPSPAQNGGNKANPVRRGRPPKRTTLAASNIVSPPSKARAVNATPSEEPTQSGNRVSGNATAKPKAVLVKIEKNASPHPSSVRPSVADLQIQDATQKMIQDAIDRGKDIAATRSSFAGFNRAPVSTNATQTNHDHVDGCACPQCRRPMLSKWLAQQPVRPTAPDGVPRRMPPILPPQSSGRAHQLGSNVSQPASSLQPVASGGLRVGPRPQTVYGPQPIAYTNQSNGVPHTANAPMLPSVQRPPTAYIQQQAHTQQQAHMQQQAQMQANYYPPFPVSQGPAYPFQQLSMVPNQVGREDPRPYNSNRPLLWMDFNARGQARIYVRDGSTGAITFIGEGGDLHQIETMMRVRCYAQWKCTPTGQASGMNVREFVQRLKNQEAIPGLVVEPLGNGRAEYYFG